MRPFQATGIWWAPNSPSSPVAGSLYFSDEEGLRLALIGTFGGPQQLTQETRPIILGASYDLPGGQLLTLRNCQQRKVLVGAPGFSQEEYRVGRAFVGGHLLKETDFCFLGAQLKLCGLEDWAVGLTGIHFRGNHGGEGLGQLVYTSTEPLIAQVPGGRVTLGVCPTVLNAARKYTVEEDVAFDIECDEPLSDAEFNTRYVYPLQNFVTLALGRPVAVREVSVQREKGPRGPSHLLPFQIVGPRVFSEQQYDAEKTASFPLLLLPNVWDRFADVIRRWLQVTNTFADTCNLYFGIQYVRKAYLDTKLLAVVQALELYQAHREGSRARQEQEDQRFNRLLGRLEEEDREWLRLRLGQSPHVPFSEVLTALTVEHGAVLDPLYGGDRKGFVAAVHAAWEYILHRRLVSDKAPQSDEDLHWLMERLRIVMKSCFLSELGFSEAEQVRLFNGNGLYQHLCSLRGSPA